MHSKALAPMMRRLQEEWGVLLQHPTHNLYPGVAVAKVLTLPAPRLDRAMHQPRFEDLALYVRGPTQERSECVTHPDDPK